MELALCMYRTHWNVMQKQDGVDLVSGKHWSYQIRVSKNRRGSLISGQIWSQQKCASTKGDGLVMSQVWSFQRVQKQEGIVWFQANFDLIREMQAEDIMLKRSLNLSINQTIYHNIRLHNWQMNFFIILWHHVTVLKYKPISIRQMYLS